MSDVVFLVNVGKRKIPVVIGAGRTRLHFTGGIHGRKEAGFYSFWTCHGEDQYGPWTVIGRARERLNAGDRFARMSPHRTKRNPRAHQRAYAKMFRLVNGTAFCIKPSTEREVFRWINSHKKDCEFLSSRCLIRGRLYKKFPRVP